MGSRNSGDPPIFLEARLWEPTKQGAYFHLHPPIFGEHANSCGTKYTEILGDGSASKEPACLPGTMRV